MSTESDDRKVVDVDDVGRITVDGEVQIPADGSSEFLDPDMMALVLLTLRRFPEGVMEDDPATIEVIEIAEEVSSRMLRRASKAAGDGKKSKKKR